MRRTNSRLTLLCLTLVIASAPRLPAQTFLPPASVERLKWGTVNVLIRSDTAHGLELWVNTSIYWRGSPRRYSDQLDPDSVPGWLDKANAIVMTESKPPGKSAIMIDSITTTSGGIVAIMRRSAGARWADHVLLVVKDKPTARPWGVDADLGQMQDFIHSAFVHASRSTYLPDSLGHGGSQVAEDSVDAPPQVHSCRIPPTPTGPGGELESGEVWTEYIVSADGDVEPSKMVVLLSDGPDLTRAAIRSILSCRFKAGTVGGKPVDVLVRQRVLFKQ